MWLYEEAFSRNNGLVSKDLQDKIKNTCVAIAGMGGVGGIHLTTLARLGIGGFHISDADKFEVANFNRQYGASICSIGESKTEVMEKLALSINPEMKIKSWHKNIDDSNVDAFLDNIDIFIDGIDFFEIDVKIMIMDKAFARGIHCITAAPAGFGTAWVSIYPSGPCRPSDYFKYNSQSSKKDNLINFATSLVPELISGDKSNLSLSDIEFETEKAPSLGLACNLASGVAAIEVIKILNNPDNNKYPVSKFFNPLAME